MMVGLAQGGDHSGGGECIILSREPNYFAGLMWGYELKRGV